MTFATGLNAALRTLLIAFVAVLGFLLGTGSAAAADGIGVRTATIHTYDTPDYDEPFDHFVSERGPPARARAVTADPVDHGSHCASSRPSLEASWAFAAYDQSGWPAQFAKATGTTQEHPEGDDRALASRAPSDVAAKTTARACSFAGATTVLMADGTKKLIEDIEVGDEVIATDPETGEQTAKTVERVFVHDDTVIDLVVDGDVITTTEDHPFWSFTDQRFERADELSAGEKVVDADGRMITVSGLEFGAAREALAYNLSVEGIHTYHVGDAEILVHNECSDEAFDIASHAFDDHGAAMGFRNADEMGTYLDDIMQSSAGHLRDDGSRFWIDYQRSAIVFRGPHPGVPGTVYRPDNFARAVQRELDRTVME